MSVGLDKQISMAAPTSLSADVSELIEVLSNLQTHLTDLVRISAEKLQALRGADADALEAHAAEENRLLRFLVEQGQSRDALVARFAQRLRLNGEDAVRLRDISGALPEPHASRIEAKSVGLRRLAQDLQEKNKMVSIVARRLHTQVREVFADVAGADQETIGYGSDGNQSRQRTRTWIDAVG